MLETVPLANSPAVGHDPGDMLTGMQIRAALALLGMSYRDLAALVDMSKNTVEAIANAENEESRGYAKTWRTIQRALEAKGVEFLDPGQPLPPGGPGVRMKGK